MTRPSRWTLTALCALAACALAACAIDVDLGRLPTTGDAESGDADTSTGVSEPTTAPGAACGDGIADPGEFCDGGGEAPDCDADCTEVRCGDGVVNEQAGEECEVLNDVEGDGCEYDCRKTPQPRIVFVTGSVYSGNLGGLAGADAKCQESAEGAGLTGTYLAWLSDNTGSPLSRMVHASVPYVLPDGTKVANDWTELVLKPLSHAIDMTELHATPPIWPYGKCATSEDCTVTWSATSSDGALYNGVYTCDDWSSEEGMTNTGNWRAVDGYWSGWVPFSCAEKLPLYCFQQ